MTQKEMDAFLLDAEKVSQAKSMTPGIVNEYIRALQRRYFALLEYANRISSFEDVEEYMAEHGNDPIPFEW